MAQMNRRQRARAAVTAVRDFGTGSQGRNAPKTGIEPPFDPTSWGGALIVMIVSVAVLWGVQIANAVDHQRLDRFGLRPRHVDGLWGVLTMPFLHQGYAHMASDSLPLLLIGWVLLLSGVRVWAFVSIAVIVVGGALAWLVAPAGLEVGASGLVFGWIGYLLARAVFARRFLWILSAVAVLVVFGALLGSLLPSVDAHASWQQHLCGFVVGIGAGWLLHPSKKAQAARAARRRPGPSPVS